MKLKLYTSLFLLAAFSLQLGAQRYLQPMFPVERIADVPYAVNISILTGEPKVDTLYMDIYLPVGDTETARPLLLVAPTGSFLPPFFNGQITGTKLDSSVTYSAGALASMGYVTAAFDYRLGWLPTSDDEDIRRGTLLQAAYRAFQDTRSCIRYFRKNANENGNEYDIDPEKIGILGIGTGGYLALGSGCLDDFGEVELEKFISTQTALPYIDSTVLGNLDGTTTTPGCLANHPGYSSEIEFSFNLGGALGDTLWMDGLDTEPAYAGVHCVNDLFAPFYEGPVIVPTTNEFVVSVPGTRRGIEYANQLGSNDILDALPAAVDPLRPLIELQKQTDVTLPTGQTVKMGTDNFFAFNLPFPQSSPWDWWDLNLLKVIIPLVNAQLGTDFNADTLHAAGLLTNPDMSPEKGKTYFDTIFALMLPRACIAMDLGCFSSSVKELNDADVDLVLGPNPASTEVVIKTNNETPIRSVYLYNLDGRLVKADVDINRSQYSLLRFGLPPGMYMARLNFEDGALTKKIYFQ